MGELEKLSGVRTTPTDDELVSKGLIFSIKYRNQRHIDVEEFIYGDYLMYPDPETQLYYADYNDIEANTDKMHSYDELLTWIPHPPIKTRLNFDQMVGSCNGLVCFSLPTANINDPVYICNPSTLESVDLPRLTSASKVVVSGFGYHHLTGEYKVVRIHYTDEKALVGHVEVYTLGDTDNGWRDKGVISYSLCSSPGVLVDGALHWLDYKDWNIVAFDLEDEEFSMVQSPPYYASSVHSVWPGLYQYDLLQEIRGKYQLKALGGCLCVVHRGDDNYMDIWSLPETEDNTEEKESWSWVRKFSIEGLDKYDDYEPFALTKNNEVLLWNNGTNLSCYDPSTSTLRLLTDDDLGMCFEYFQALPHLTTSVSLIALEEKYKMQRECVSDSESEAEQLE